MRISFLGTSHTYDRFNTHPTYQSTSGTGLTWCEYIGEKLAVHVDNRGLVALGVDTYFARLYTYLENNPKPDMVVIEIPGTYRFSYPIDKHTSDVREFGNSRFWDAKGRYMDSLMIITKGDIVKKYSVSEVENLNKFNRINKNATIPIQPSQYIDFVNSHLFFDHKYLLYDNFVKTLVICEYLKQKQITPLCWTFDAITDLNSALVGDITNQMNLVSNKSVKRIAEDLGYSPSDSSYYPDGTHLIQEKWRDIADRVFIPMIQKNLR